MGDVERVMERVHRLLAIANDPAHPTTSSA